MLGDRFFSCRNNHFLIENQYAALINGYYHIKKTIALLTILIVSIDVLSQEIELSGIISDIQHQQISDVVIQARQSKNITYSDSQGRYKIMVGLGDVVTFSHDNYETYFLNLKSIPIERNAKSTTYHVTLSPKLELYNFSLEDLMRIEVVSVSKKTEKLNETPQTVIVISQEEIKVRGYTDIEQIFHDLPGFDISRGFGTEYSQIYQRGYRSNNTDRTLFLVDGVEENDLWSGSAWIGRQFPINNIEKIEVIYGPSTTVYGPNAFIGAVNVVTKDITNIIKPGHRFGVQAHTSFGSWNTYFSDLTLATQKNDLSLSITGRIYKSDEMDLSGYSDWNYSFDDYTLEYYKETLGTQSDEIAALAQNHDRYQYLNSQILNGLKPKYSNQTLNYYLYGKLNLKNFTLGFETFKRNEGYGGWYTDRYELGTDHGCSWIPKNSFLYVKYKESLSDAISVNSFTTFRQHGIDGDSKELYYVGYFNGEIDITGLTDENGQVVPEEQQEKPYWFEGYYHTYSFQVRSELSINYEISGKINLISGAEYRHSHIQGQYLVSETTKPEETGIPEILPGGNHFFSNDFGLFAQLNYSPIDRFFVVAGGRLDNNRIRKTGGYGTVFNPKVAAIYSPKNVVIKFVYSEAFKDADFWTKYGTTPGRLLNNPGLLPEKVKNIDISIGWKLSNRIFVDVVGYQSFYDGVVGTADVTFIDEDGNTVNTTQHQAIGKLLINGVQSSVNIKSGNYSAFFNYTFTNPYNTTKQNRVRIGDIASHQVNFGAAYNIRSSTTLSLRCNWVGERKTGKNTTISSNPYNHIDSYFVVNSAVNQKIWKGISAQLSAFNLLNTVYFHPGVRSANGTYYAARIPQYERHFFVKLMVEL